MTPKEIKCFIIKTKKNLVLHDKIIFKKGFYMFDLQYVM